MKIEIIILLSVEILYFPTTRIYLWLGLEDKKFSYVAYSAQLSNYKRKLFTASEERPQLLTTHEERYRLQEKVKCSFYHSLLSWDRLTRSIFQIFLGENTAQIPKLSIYFFPCSHLAPISTGYSSDTFLSSVIYQRKADCCHFLSRDISLGELLPLKFLCVRPC